MKAGVSSYPSLQLSTDFEKDKEHCLNLWTKSTNEKRQAEG